MTPVRLLDPTITPARRAIHEPAPRLGTLAGATIGLLANGKTNGMPLLDGIAHELRRTHRIGKLVHFTKPGVTAPSRPIADADLEMMAEHCLAIISAIGD